MMRADAIETENISKGEDAMGGRSEQGITGEDRGVEED